MSNGIVASANRPAANANRWRRSRVQMYDYLQLLRDNHMILGDYDPSKVSGLPPQWFWDRQVDLIDFRGDLQIRCSESITFGFRVRILTASHTFETGGIGETIYKPVWIDKGVFVGSFALLYNCHLEHHSVVACGSVVRNMTVPPYTMVEGNPARIIKKWEDGVWQDIRNSE